MNLEYVSKQEIGGHPKRDSDDYKYNNGIRKQKSTTNNEDAFSSKDIRNMVSLMGDTAMLLEKLYCKVSDCCKVMSYSNVNTSSIFQNNVVQFRGTQRRRRQHVNTMAFYDRKFINACRSVILAHGRNLHLSREYTK